MEFKLKTPTREDKTSLIYLCNHIERKYLSDRIPDPYTEESADWWIQMIADNEGKTGVWRAIYIDDKMVGCISVEQKSDIYRVDGEIGYYLLTEYWSQGIMSRAVKEICRIAFDTLDIVRITGRYMEPNIASGRVLQKAGFIYEGTKKNGAIKNGRIYNYCIMGLLKEEFLSLKQEERLLPSKDTEHKKG